MGGGLVHPEWTPSVGVFLFLGGRQAGEILFFLESWSWSSFTLKTAMSEPPSGPRVSASKLGDCTISSMGSTTLYSSLLASCPYAPVCHSPQRISASRPSISTPLGSLPHFTLSSLQLSCPRSLVTQQHGSSLLPLASVSLHK